MRSAQPAPTPACPSEPPRRTAITIATGGPPRCQPTGAGTGGSRGAGYHGPVTPRATTIETARLILRPFNADDFDDLYAYQSRPDVARYLTWEARDHAQ